MKEKKLTLAYIIKRHLVVSLWSTALMPVGNYFEALVYNSKDWFLYKVLRTIELQNFGPNPFLRNILAQPKAH